MIVWLSSPKASRYDDPSDKLWSVYVAETSQYDKALIESWTSDMDGILIFVGVIVVAVARELMKHSSKSGLFSAVITAFIIDGYKNLSQDSESITIALLAQI